MNFVVRISEAIIRVALGAAATMLAIMVALVTYQVITRFILGESAVWSEVLARALMLWGVFLIVGPAIRSGKMIPIDILHSLLPDKKKIWLTRTVTAAISVFLFILIWFGYKMSLRVLDQKVAMLDVSATWLYAAIPVGATIALPGLLLAHLDAERGHASSTGIPE